MGSNALIRRAALEGVGGYQPGLAEDLATSIALHAAGWRSAYVAEPLAPGLAPASLLAWYTQQLKWARGVFEILMTSFPRVFARLDRGQRLAYIVRTTKYWIGPAVLVHLAISGGAIVLSEWPTRSLVQDYLLHMLPLVLADLWIRREALRLWRHSSVLAIVPLRAFALIYFSWPVYTLAWIMAVLRLPLGFRPTPKTTPGRLKFVFLLPQIISSLALLVVLFRAVTGGYGLSTPFLLGFVAAQIGLQLWFIGSWTTRQIASWCRQLASEASVWASISDV
jgi:cellulose synthase (UDP-forming)